MTPRLAESVGSLLAGAAAFSPELAFGSAWAGLRRALATLTGRGGASASADVDVDVGVGVEPFAAGDRGAATVGARVASAGAGATGGGDAAAVAGTSASIARPGCASLGR